MICEKRCRRWLQRHVTNVPICVQDRLQLLSRRETNCCTGRRGGHGCIRDRCHCGFKACCLFLCHHIDMCQARGRQQCGDWQSPWPTFRSCGATKLARRDAKPAPNEDVLFDDRNEKTLSSLSSSSSSWLLLLLLLFNIRPGQHDWARCLEMYPSAKYPSKKPTVRPTYARWTDIESIDRARCLEMAPFRHSCLLLSVLLDDHFVFDEIDEKTQLSTADLSPDAVCV